jgi:hypothetical protein
MVPASGPTGDDVGDLTKLARDQRWFLAIFVVKVALGLVTFAIKPCTPGQDGLGTGQHLRGDDDPGDRSEFNAKTLSVAAVAYLAFTAGLIPVLA